MQEAISCLCLSSPELGKEPTSSWSLIPRLPEELGQGVFPSCCTCCLQEAENLEIQAPPPPQSWGREVLQCQKFSHRAPNWNPTSIPPAQ